MKGVEKRQMAQELSTLLERFHRNIHPLIGITPPENKIAFIDQVIDSLQRVEYVGTIGTREISNLRTDPANTLFDPIKAAFLKKREGDLEEACWLIFLATHCGRHLETEWLLARELYGAYEQQSWTWVRVVDDPQAYMDWLAENHKRFRGKFGNHRKYESLKPRPKGTSAVINSYVNWIRSFESHRTLFNQAMRVANNDKKRAFAFLYEQMSNVLRFGRTGKFDYLTMLAKVGLVEIEANSTYLHEATGPLTGARLLFDGRIDSRTSPKELEFKVAKLDRLLNVGMQVLEDSMCNWQKSPNRYLPFRG